VLIRIGINDLGDHAVLDALSHDRNAPEPNARIDACLAEIGKTVALIRSHHPIRMSCSSACSAMRTGRSSSTTGVRRGDRQYRCGPDRYDNGLRKPAAADRQHVVFLDDRAWFRGLRRARRAGPPALTRRCGFRRAGL
jgi:hypothetical protein